MRQVRQFLADAWHRASLRDDSGSHRDETSIGYL